MEALSPTSSARKWYEDPVSREQINKHRNTVSSISVNLCPKPATPVNQCKNWIDISEKIVRLPPVKKKFELVNRLNIGEGSGLYSVAIGPEADQVAFGMDSGQIQLLDMASLIAGRRESSICLRKPYHTLGKPSSVTCLRFAPSMKNILFGCDLSGIIDVFDTQKNCKQNLNKEDKNEINAIDVDIFATKVASGGRDGQLRVYDAFTGKIIYITPSFLNMDFYANPWKYHRMRIHCIKFDRKNFNVFFTGGLDGYLKVWDLRDSLKCVKTIKGPYIRGDAIDIHDNILLTGSFRATKSLDFWDITTGKHIESLIPLNRNSIIDGEFFDTVKFFKGVKDGSLILTGGGGTNRLEVFNVLDRRTEFSIKMEKYVRGIDCCSKNILSVGLGGFCANIKYGKFKQSQ